MHSPLTQPVRMRCIIGCVSKRCRLTGLLETMVSVMTIHAIMMMPLSRAV